MWRISKITNLGKIGHWFQSLCSQDHVTKAKDYSLAIKVNKNSEEAWWNGELKLYNDIYSNEKLRRENTEVLLEKNFPGSNNNVSGLEIFSVCL